MKDSLLYMAGAETRVRVLGNPQYREILASDLVATTRAFQANTPVRVAEYRVPMNHHLCSRLCKPSACTSTSWQSSP